MRNINAQELARAKKRVEILKNTPVCVHINKGRNKIVRLQGRITGSYPAVFTVTSDDDGALFTLSYNDIVSGNVKFYRVEVAR